MTNLPNPIRATHVDLSQTPARAHDAVDAIRRAAPAPLSHSDAVIARVAWSVIVEPGDVDAGTLIRQHGPVAALRLLLNPSEVDVPARLIEQVGRQYNPSRVARRLTLTDQHEFSILTPEDDAWPAALHDLGDAAPLLLWCDGNPDVLNAERVTAIAGSRAATSYGEHVALSITTDLVAAGHAIVTGAAYGIDGMATRATLANSGTPIVVLAGGVDRPYPAGHHDLIARVAARGGVVISELPPSSAPTRWKFLQRNRIIAALSHQVVIVEAGARSGTLNAAGHANAIGRPVFAIPGPITSATSAGCHRLIQDGHARLAVSAIDLDVR
ncbi:DNA-processing protein DprA [Herbiconiux sp. VKM Ac-2851]|uniref:DNA-processing protein DprA n=1 Tax=Herbiconiux sp. VKM Ac-2851 TaxID=2739025 RepID=UPI001567744E|nr:DNA-processing protein DprA [Herbiconiux sp. VKM Ac-2851]NQX37074.1 DNA-protecting protein DprA [Herbiconiux sp. VKM Ac-2851]